tara:strand:- start:338 stop:919 length:582 start_codon:yes stop_codon:yes gene_type:complete
MIIKQFSPIRTGSTLIYNFIKKCGRPVNKLHSLEGVSSWVVSTIRHPYNSIISAILRLEKPINEKTLEYCTNEYLGQGGRDFLNLPPKSVVLRYEDFTQYPWDAFSFLNSQLNLGKTSEELESLVEQLSLDNMLKIQSKHKDFMTWDKETQIHGNHISKYKGKTDWKKLLSPKQIQHLQTYKELNQIIEKYYG